MLKRVMPADELRNWKLFHAECPLDDQSNYHLPIAYLQSTLFNVNRGQYVPARSLNDFRLFRARTEDEEGEEDSDIDAQLLGSNW